MQQQRLYLLLVLVFALIFATCTLLRPPLKTRSHSALPEDQIVISAPIQVILLGGDRFLAADIQAIRSSVIIGDDVNTNAYRVRSHLVASELNPCHEDNYYLANSVLTWGGSEEMGDEILKRAMSCRFWDELPAFLHGFNLYFFNHDNQGAVGALEVAASRSTDNAAAYRKFAIMIAVEKINDTQMALNYLRDQRYNSQDPKLAALLDKRITRLEGLMVLQDAQQRYEQQFGKPLDNPNTLLTTGVLKQFPVDPMRLGYEFHEGRFRLRTVKILGLENRP